MGWLRRIFEQDPQIPDALWQDCVEHLPCLNKLAPDDLARLKRHSETLLGSKTMTGVAGLTMTDQIAVSIAAQACLPVLNLSLDLYRDLTAIVVYPAAFMVRRREMDEAGVVHEWKESLSGEAMDAGGAIVLSWEDVADRDALDFGGNVVIHEFAHKIDMQDGGANGRPPFLAAFHAGMSSLQWQQVFSAAYEDLVERVALLEQALPPEFSLENAAHQAHYQMQAESLPLDPYAATAPAEFFAVASEAFFVSPELLHTSYPLVYAQLAAYYRQTPLPRA